MTSVDAERTFDNVWKTIALDETLISGVEGTLRSNAVTTARGAPALLAVLPGLAAGDAGDPGADLELGDVLGIGGMGVVRLARQRSLGRDVAVKMLRPDASDERAVVALVHEATVAGSLEHPNIVPVHALGTSEREGPMLVMKRIAGVSLHDLLHDEDHPGWERVEGDRQTFALEVLMQVCNAAHFAHSRGVVHRDVKSDNVMIGEFGEVYLLDWGVAWDLNRAAGEGGPPGVVGTPVYMAPEMLEGGARVGPQTDVYLLGGLLHEILTRRPRHAGSALYDVLRAAFASTPAVFDSSVPRELAAICQRATSRAPEHRFPTALAMRQAVSEFLRHRSSLELADEAAARLQELAAAVASPGAAPDELRIHKLFAECRFGFQQSLRAWPDNPRAVAGIERAIATMIEHELGRRNATAAAVLVAELPRPRPDLDARIAALRDELREEGRDVERLRAMERDLDPAVASRQRTSGALVLGVGLSAALFVIARLVRSGALPLSHARRSARRWAPARRCS